MTTNSISLPKELRLRSLHPLIEIDDGSCPLLYDLERTFIIEVPVEFRFRINPAFKTGDLDEALVEWLMHEDLLTSEKPRDWAQGTQPDIPQLTDVSLDMSGACNLGCVYCFENDIDSRVGPMLDETAMASLDFVFKKTEGAPRIALHFGSGEPLMRFDLLERIVAEANRRAEASGQEISYELTTNATLVTQEIAKFLCDHPFNVRVSCDGPSHLHNKFRPFHRGQNSYFAVEKGLRWLLEYLPERLTVNSVLSGGTRLSELWAWAKELRLRHYHVIKVGAYADSDINIREIELRDFRTDLELVCDDMVADLEVGRIPIDYQPVTKVVRRLMLPEPITRFCGVAGSYLGVASNGKVYPCFRHLGLKQYDLGNIWHGVDNEKRQHFLGHEAADVDSRPVCEECWARYLCGGGCYADSTVYGSDKLKPQVQHCPFWRTEIEMAIRFYDRLRRTNPIYCLSLFGDDADAILDSMDKKPSFLQRKNCG